MTRPLIAAALLFFSAPLIAEDQPSAPSPGEIVAAAPQAEWNAIAASDLLVMDLAPDAKGKPRRVMIQLMPQPFSQGWIGNIRKLAAAHWWDGLSVNRVQDNYVVQWGDADAGDEPPARATDTEAVVAERMASYRRLHPRANRAAVALAERKVRQAVMNAGIGKALDIAEKPKARALPDGLMAVPEADYVATFGELSIREVPPDTGFYMRPVKGGPFVRFASRETVISDLYAPIAIYHHGWPVALMRDPDSAAEHTLIWPIHCYGMVGVGRNLSPDTGSGAELYTVIGHAPRHLDRNIALVGRVIEGIEHLSSLPRGTGALGFYETPEERTTILSVRPGSEVAGLPAYEYLSTEGKSFAAYAEARANRRDAFFIRPAGGADVCNVPVPVRRVKG